jgi:acylpyruvate hydrolase
LYFEVELGIVIKSRCSKVKESEVDSYIGGYCLVLDMTARDFQMSAQSKDLPWCLSKGYDTACPVSEFIPKEKVKNQNDIELWLKVNDEIKQQSSTNDMIFSISHVISYISSYVTLEEGDVVITGTPAGIGPVRPGDVIKAGLADIMSMTFPVA